jgi:lipoyl(octanoyl) transferase
MKNVDFKDLKIIDYKEAWNFQETLFNEIVNLKAKNRALPIKEQIKTKNFLLFCEHPHVYTLGKSGTENNMLIADEFLKKINATFYKTNRGGDITYHGPGQLVGYPILDLDNFGFQVREYIYKLEEAIILLLKDYGIESSRLEGATGVWLDIDKPGKTRKICAMGVRASRWVTMHGFALNVNTDLNYFNYINPCGFVDKGVTSMEKELGDSLNFEEVKNNLKNKIKEVFEIEYL